MIKVAVSSAALLLATAFLGQARAQAVVEDPGYCAQFYPNSNCQNYGPGNPLYPGAYGPYPNSSGPVGQLPLGYAGPPPLRYAPHHSHRHRRHY